MNTGSGPDATAAIASRAAAPRVASRETMTISAPSRASRREAARRGQADTTAGAGDEDGLAAHVADPHLVTVDSPHMATFVGDEQFDYGINRLVDGMRTELDGARTA